jgi:phosphoglycerate dehydrogenase-like enzyme
MRVFASGALTEQWMCRFQEEFDFAYDDSWVDGDVLDRDQLLAKLQGCHILITEIDRIDAELLDHLPDLFAIVDMRGVPVNVDIEAATAHGVVVINTPGRNAEAVADLTVMLMIMLARNVCAAMDSLQSNEWMEKGQVHNYFTHKGIELPGRTVGLVGFGAIGRKVAQRLRAFDMHILAYDPFVKDSDLAEMVDLPALLQRADFVSLHAPVTPSTENMIGAAEFALMQPTAFFVNTARAKLVDEQAMIDALRHGKIAGAGLDVFHREPMPADAPLFQLPNVVAIPHLGGATHDVTDHQSRMAYESVKGLLRGEAIRVVNSEAFDDAQRRIKELTS